MGRRQCKRVCQSIFCCYIRILKARKFIKKRDFLAHNSWSWKSKFRQLHILACHEIPCCAMHGGKAEGQTDVCKDREEQKGRCFTTTVSHDNHATLAGTTLSPHENRTSKTETLNVSLSLLCTTVFTIKCQYEIWWGQSHRNHSRGWGQVWSNRKWLTQVIVVHWRLGHNGCKEETEWRSSSDVQICCNAVAMGRWQFRLSLYTAICALWREMEPAPKQSKQTCTPWQAQKRLACLTTEQEGSPCMGWRGLSEERRFWQSPSNHVKIKEAQTPGITRKEAELMSLWYLENQCHGGVRKASPSKVSQKGSSKTKQAFSVTVFERQLGKARSIFKEKLPTCENWK